MSAQDESCSSEHEDRASSVNDDSDHEHQDDSDHEHQDDSDHEHQDDSDNQDHEEYEHEEKHDGSHDDDSTHNDDIEENGDSHDSVPISSVSRKHSKSLAQRKGKNNLKNQQSRNQDQKSKQNSQSKNQILIHVQNDSKSKIINGNNNKNSRNNKSKNSRKNSRAKKSNGCDLDFESSTTHHDHDNDVSMVSAHRNHLNGSLKTTSRYQLNAEDLDDIENEIDHIENNEISVQEVDEDDENDSGPKSFLLIDENEILQCSSSDEFAQMLDCNLTPNSLVKVVSIFGSIGHGKSFTLNHTFFNQMEVFKTSSTQDSCTIGIWSAYDPKRKVITLDTEGLLGVSGNCQRRTRLLLKILAISDIVIYRTRSERLEDNLFTFLGDASRVYIEHFSKELKNVDNYYKDFENGDFKLSHNDHPGPMIIIFHETRDTEPLQLSRSELNGGQTRENLIRSRFKTLGLTTEAFSAIEYVGIRTPERPTNFDSLRQCIKRQIKNCSARTPRLVGYVYATIRMLNEKFNGDIEREIPSMFSTQHLTCSTVCLSCNARCVQSMNHHRDGQPHRTDRKCKYQYQYNNHVLYCRACYERGDEIVVHPKTCSSSESPWLGLAKYAWAGYVLECSRCGVIFRSRQYWFGNKDPAKQYMCESSVRTEIKHVWPGELNSMQASQNTAQRVLDSVSYFTETVTSISAKPTKMVSEWVADQIAPTYWVPNSRILHCALCGQEFGQHDQKHHCRLCGNGLCSTCSSKSKPVPERGWGQTSVRVCDRCYESSNQLSALPPTFPFYPLNSPYPPSSLMGDNGNVTTNNSCDGDGGDCKNLCKKSISFGNLSTNTNSIAQMPTSCVVGSGLNRQFQSTTISNHNHNNNNSVRANNINGIQRNSCGHVSAACSASITAGTKLNHSEKCNGQNKMGVINGATKSTHIYTNGTNSGINNKSLASTSSSSSSSLSNTNDQQQKQDPTITARKLGEAVQSTIKTVLSPIDYTLLAIKESARPDYWLPDSQIVNCGLCKQKFNEIVTIHHCRRCGGGFCSDCSSKTKPVPERGWADASVRVCDKCYDEA